MAVFALWYARGTCELQEAAAAVLHPPKSLVECGRAGGNDLLHAPADASESERRIRSTKLYIWLSDVNSLESLQRLVLQALRNLK